LPLPLTKKFFHGKRSAEDLQETPLTLGMRAGLCHPTTGYSFPMAVKTVEVLLNTHLEEEWSHELEKLRRIILRDQKFFMLLNRVMFLATSPNQRFRFLQHFYRLPEDIISGFYAHRLTVWDKARFFMRTPPVPVFSAVHAMKQEALHGI